MWLWNKQNKNENFVYICIAFEDSIIKKGWDPINRFDVYVQSLGLNFYRLMSWSFLDIRFDYIGGIVEHLCFNLLKFA